MKKKIRDLYAPIYERAMRTDRKVYSFVYERIPTVIRGKEVLEIAAGRFCRPSTWQASAAFAASNDKNRTEKQNEKTGL